VGELDVAPPDWRWHLPPPENQTAIRFKGNCVCQETAMTTIPVEPYPDQPVPVPPQPDIPPVKEPEPDRLPDELPNPNPDENDEPPKVFSSVTR